MDQIRQETVVAQVMRRIRELIASGAYAPGDKIPTEKALAEQFGIGRSSVREAIKIFNYLGVLESRAAIGTVVQPRSNISSEALSWSLLLGVDELEEMIDARGAIELWSLLSLVSGCGAGDPEALGTLGALDSIVDDMNRIASAGDRQKMIEADFLFHNTIVTSAENELFSSLFETLRSFLYEEIRRSQSDYDDPNQIADEHRQLVDPIRRGNQWEAVLAHTRHIENIKERLRHQASRMPPKDE